MKFRTSQTVLIGGLCGLISAWTVSAEEKIDNWDISTGSEVSQQSVAAQKAQDELPYLSIRRQIPSSDQNYELHFIFSRDEIHIPVGVRKPEGEGPFPIILFGRGNGHGGYTTIDRSMYELEPMMDMLIERGYAVAYGTYRNEIPRFYNEINRSENIKDDMSGGARALKSTPTLDSDDYIEIVEHLKSLSFTDPKGVGTIGVSHSGELQLKAATQISWGAAVPIEGASHEFLAVDTINAPREGRVLQLQDTDTVKRLADLETARSRIAKINTPFLHMGRDDDHLQGIFRLAYELMEEADKSAQWVSFDHSVHGYGFLYRKEDGTFDPDEMQMEAFRTWLSFFDRHLKSQDTAAAE